GPALVLHNKLPEAGHWLLVKLQGKPPNTDAIGAVVTVTAGKLKMMRVVQSGTSYLSQDDMRRHFGLGTAARADSVVVRWPDGSTTTLEDVAADRVLEVAQK